MLTGAGWKVEAGSSRVLERAIQDTAWISSRGRRGSKGQSGESLEDGAERGEGGLHCERIMPASPDQVDFVFWGRVEAWVGRV